VVAICAETMELFRFSAGGSCIDRLSWHRLSGVGPFRKEPKGWTARQRPALVIYFIKCTPQAARVITTVAAPPKAITLYDALRAADSDITRLRFQRAWQAR